jgi:hypothetical protein
MVQMAFTWNGDPAASTLEEIRWHIGDIVEANAKFTDAEINYAYDEEGTVLGAAALLCEQLAATYAESVSRALGPLRVELSNLMEQYEKKAEKFRKRAQALTGTPYAANISQTDEEAWEDNTDIKQPIFEKGMHDNK